MSTRLSQRCRLVVLFLMTVFTHTASAAPTHEVRIPLSPDAAFIQQVVASQVFSDPGNTARVWDDGACSYLVLSNPRVQTGSGQVTVLSDAEARIGQQLGSRCLVLGDWAGRIATHQSVALEPGSTALRFEVVDSEIRARTASSGLPLDTLWEWIKQYVHPRLAAVRIDLAPALEDLKSVLGLVLTDPGEASTSPAVLDTITLDAVTVEADGLRVELAMQVPARSAPPSPPAAALSAAELARFEAAWQGFDGFVTFLVKHFAARSATPELRRELLAVLIEARYDVLDMLAADATVRRTDPVRRLFMNTWTRLAPVLRQMSPELAQERALNLLSFITAADALRALDALGPQYGFEISLDGLRRLARIVAPESPRDPLQYDDNVDPELRQLFDLGPPLPRRPQAEPPQSRWRGLIPEAHAAAPLDASLAQRLQHWAPTAEDLEVYLHTVHRLLDTTSRQTAAQSELAAELVDMYRALVLATAWQETCWRQYRRVDGEVVPMRSAAGALGMMQVMPRVWRGFYEPSSLASDVVYNATAGSEILMLYLTNYALKQGEERHAGGIENLARASYAAYNGGPSQVARYRSADTPEALREIDAAFSEKFRAVASGDELAVRACYSEN